MITVKDNEEGKSYAFYYENVGPDAMSSVFAHLERGAEYTFSVRRINPSSQPTSFTYVAGKPNALSFVPYVA